MKMSSGERWHPKKEEPSRRKFLLGTASALGVGMVGAIKLQEESDRDHWDDDAGPYTDASLEKPVRFLELAEQKREYDTGALAGKQFGYPISAYLGTKDRLGATTAVDFRYRLAQMWKEKAGKIRVDEAKRTALMRSIDDIVMSYDPEKAMSMSGAYYYLELVESIKQVRDEIDWGKIHSTFRLSGAQDALFRSFEKYLDAQTLLAFNLSEIMPSQGSSTFKVFDTLLKTGGYEFIQRIPSGGDNEMSFGPGQVTAKIFSEEKNNRGSVAIMSGVLKKRDMVTKDVAQLRGRQHHMASYLDALFNLVRLVQKMPDAQAAAIMNEPVGDDVRMFVSGAHNRPSDAVDSFRRFAASYLIAREHGGQARPRFATFCTKQIAPYVERTEANLAEVRLQKGMS